MLTLGLDSTSAYCSVSLVDDARVLGHISEKINRGHAERLAPMVDEVLTEASVDASAIERIAVCTGPGSFTGLRVALAYAKGFALPRSLPVIGIDALAVTAQSIRFSKNDHLVGVMRDIRRGQVFYATYSHGEAIEPPRAMTLEEAETDAETLQAAIYESTHIDTRILAWLAMDADPADYPAVPLYSRAPDAKLPGGKSPK
ncbi:tRNA (adenosine(37)-N6)-threonylcarbamoyltransferase complex dimerization subunit type 1 TsaB [Litorimonas sp. RW-G-Af-16]|uniref:tRNA (adenosine(37)-N6)-threonylcarbamoyltransferase complex dimerization subunit type 1 TsaB n=1 Tax=Litorimonas sp. RW-G-Af-16 TaxID=3241168 RepID=UPI00390C4158